MTIISQLNLKDQPSAAFHQAKIALNNEFDEKARITGLVGLIYYPVSTEGPMPHAQIEVEGRCYITTTGSRTRKEYKSLSKKIHRANNGGTPFGHIGLCVTPKELRQLNANVTKNPTSNCMKGVSNALKSNTSISIPFIFSNFPTFSAGYLCSRKYFGDRNITSLKWYQDGNTREVNIGKNISTVLFPSLEIFGVVGSSIIATDVITQVVIPRLLS